MATTLPTFTFFDRKAMPINLITVSDFGRLAEALSLKNWQAAARYYARHGGGSLVLQDDGSLLVYTRSGDKLIRSVYARGKWGWDFSC